MAIAYNSTSEIRGTTGTSTTVAHTTVSGKNLVLVTGVECQTGDNVTGVTANGQAMTQYVNVATNVASFQNYFYYYKNPPIGTFNIVTSWTGSRTVISLSAAYSGVDQTTPLEASNNNQATSSSFTVSVTTVTDNAWLVSTFRNNSAGTQTASTNTTYRNGDSGDVGYKLYDSNGAQTPAGSYSQNVSFTVSSLYTGTVVALRPATGGSINYDTGATSTDWTSGTSKSTPSITVASQSNRVMIAKIFFSKSGTDGVSTVKWNTSETFTLGAKIQNPGNEWEYTYYLVNPTATTSTVDVTSSGAPSNGRITVDTYYGAGTPTQFTTNSNSAGFTATLTVGANSWIGWCSGAQRDTAITAGGTLRQLNQSLASMDSNADLAAGSQSLQGTWSGATNTIIYFELPVPATGLSPSVNDTVTVSENISLQINTAISVNDTVTVSENIQLTVKCLPSVSDTVTVSEGGGLSVTLTNSIVAYWKLDESSGNASDATGGGMTLTNTGTATYNTGKINNGITVATGKYLATSAGVTVFTNAFTIAFWASPNTSDMSNIELFAIAPSSGTANMVKAEGNATTGFRVIVWNSSGILIKDYRMTGWFALNTWVHCAITWDGTNLLMYKNAVSQSPTKSIDSAGSLTSTSRFVGLGIEGPNTGGGNAGNEILDEFGIWSRALTSNEIASLYNSNVGNQYSFVSTTPTLQINDLPNINDTVTISENVSLLVKSNPVITENVTIAENIALSIRYSPSVNDTVTIAENISLNIVTGGGGGSLSVSVSDTVTIIEAITVVSREAASLFDLITVSENITMKINTFISVYDVPAVSDVFTFNIDQPLRVTNVGVSGWGMKVKDN